MHERCDCSAKGAEFAFCKLFDRKVNFRAHRTSLKWQFESYPLGLFIPRGSESDPIPSPEEHFTCFCAYFAFSLFGSWHRFDELCGYPIIQNSFFAVLCLFFSWSQLMHNSCMRVWFTVAFRLHCAIVRKKKMASLSFFLFLYFSLCFSSFFFISSFSSFLFIFSFLDIFPIYQFFILFTFFIFHILF